MAHFALDKNHITHSTAGYEPLCNYIW